MSKIKNNSILTIQWTGDNLQQIIAFFEQMNLVADYVPKYDCVNVVGGPMIPLGHIAMYTSDGQYICVVSHHDWTDGRSGWQSISEHESTWPKSSHVYWIKQKDRLTPNPMTFSVSSREKIFFNYDETCIPFEDVTHWCPAVAPDFA